MAVAKLVAVAKLAGEARGGESAFFLMGFLVASLTAMAYMRALPFGARARPPMSCVTDATVFVISEPSAPCIVFEDEHIAVVSKPANMPLDNGSKKAVSLLDWADDALTGSTLDKFEAVTPLTGEIGGLVVLAKTTAAAECLRVGLTTCEYAAVVSGAPSSHGTADSSGSMRLNWLETSAGKPHSGRGFVHARSLSLVAIHVDGTEGGLSCQSVCDEFGELGLCVLGAVETVPGQKVRAKREARRVSSAAATDGGVHLSLVGIELPPDLAEMRGAPSAFRIAPPLKFAKRMKRERLDAARRVSA